MINNIAFTGREGMLTKGLQELKTSYEYIGAGKIYTPKEISAVKTQIKEIIYPNIQKGKYTSPYDIALKTDNQTVEGRIKQENISYAISHGTPGTVVKEALHNLNILV